MMARRHAAAFFLFIALSIAMTWPLARTLDRAVAYPGDPYLNTWILDWDWYATFHHPLSLFDANAFYPSRFSLAFSENLYGIAILVFPLRAVGVSPITAYNVSMLGGFVVSGFGAYLLVCLVVDDWLAAIVAGVFFEFVPFRFTHLSHVQYAWGGTIPLMLAALLWYERRPTWPRAALFAAAFLFNGLCNIHWLLFGSVAIAATVAVIRPRVMPLIMCVLPAAAVLVVFLQPYFQVEHLYGLHRTWDETKDYSALPGDWLVSNFHNPLYVFLRNPKVNPERWLFPGALAIALGGVGIFSRRWKSISIAFTWILLGFVGSLGLHTFFYRFLFEHVPGFGGIRVPARWASIAYVGLAMLVGLGVATLRRRWVSVALTIAFLVELRSAPIRWYMALPEPPPVDRWIAAVKPHAIFQLPGSEGSDYLMMLRATAHHRPMVNCISGFTPPPSQRIYELANSWSDQLIPELQRVGVTHVIARADAFGAESRAWLSRAIARGELRFVRRFDAGIGGDWVFSVGGGATPPSPELAAMLEGKPTFSEHTFGVLEQPQPEETIRATSVATGFAFSPYGIREVNLLMNNGAIRIPTQLLDDPALKRTFPWYDATTRPRFVASFAKRPRGMWTLTDVQVEIIDGRGQRTLLDDRWVGWP
jgi:hypothetical protein